jgi:very-short-patch-repair endonuclease
MTTPARTAYDLARGLSRTEAVVAVDALTHRFPFELDELRSLRSRHLAARGSRRLEEVLALVDRRSGSPMESRMRVPMVLDGLAPEVQLRVVLDGHSFYLDLAFSSVRLAVEFDGAHHRTAAQARRDLWREATLAAAGWKIIRFDAGTVLRRPQSVVAGTRIELARRGWRAP